MGTFPVIPGFRGNIPDIMFAGSGSVRQKGK